MAEKDIIAGLNSIAAKYGYGKNGNEAGIRAVEELC